MEAHPYGFRIVGSPFEHRRLVDHAAAFVAYCSCDERADVNREAYLSAFTFGADFAGRADQWGRLDVAGFVGPCWSPWLWFDVDRADLDAALTDARRLAAVLDDRYRLGSDDLLVFFSGSKGFHLGLPLSICGTPPPSVTFNRTALRFAEHVAELAGVPIDTGVYDKVRPFRAPNSRHPKTGFHKHRLMADELMGLKLAKITERARAPAPFDVPTPTRASDTAAADWTAAAELVASDHQAKAARQANGSPTLNRATLTFIREGAAQGDRHRLLFSAAANLGEFGCPPALAVALLEESALDCGLPPKEARRQIECGLAAVPSPSPAAGDSGPVAMKAADAPAIGTADAGAVGLDVGAGSSSARDAAPSEPLGTGAPPAVDLRADLARLWTSTAATSAPGPGPAPAGERSKAKGLPLAVGAEPKPLQSSAPPRKPGPIPPPGARLFYFNDKMRPCSAAECYQWTWEGAPRWFYAAEFPPPGTGEGWTP
jgi:hypothetical protein